MKKYKVHIIWLVIALVALGGGFYWGKASAAASRGTYAGAGALWFFHAAGLRARSGRRRYCGWTDHDDRQLEHHAPACEREFGGGVLFQFHAGDGTDDGFGRDACGRDQRDGGGNDQLRRQCDRADDPGAARGGYRGIWRGYRQRLQMQVNKAMKNLRISGDFFRYPQGRHGWIKGKVI